MKRQKDDAALAARGHKRQWARTSPDNTPSLKGITLSQGKVARVVDISRGGALIETDVRLCPQTKVGFKVLMAQGDFRITGSVLRSSIKSLKGAPIYQSAIVFENPFTVLAELESAKADMDELIQIGDDIEEAN